MRIAVVRLSGSGAAGADFRIFPDAMAAWARRQSLDRRDYDYGVLPEDSWTLYAKVAQIVTALGEGGPGGPEGFLVVGVPAPLDLKGRVLFSPQIPGLSEDGGERLRDVVSGKWAWSLLANNTNLWAQAELSQGAAQGISGMMLVSLGSGIGAAFSLRDGEVYQGSQGLAGEIGHIVVNPEGPLCACGQRGCLERYVSGDALKWFASERGISVGQPSELASLPAAEGIIAEARALLAREIFNTIRPLDIQHVLVGGALVDLFGVTKLEGAINAMRSYFMPPVHVRPCQFGPREGVLVGGGQVGARLLADYTGKALPRRLVLVAREDYQQVG